MVGDGLFKLAVWVSLVGWHVRASLVVVDLLSWMELLVRVFAGGWLLDGAFRSVFVRRWRIYCMFSLVCWFRLLVRVRSIGAAVVAIVDGVGPVVVLGGC